MTQHNGLWIFGLDHWKKKWSKIGVPRNKKSWVVRELSWKLRSPNGSYRVVKNSDNPIKIDNRKKLKVGLLVGKSTQQKHFSIAQMFLPRLWGPPFSLAMRVVLGRTQLQPSALPTTSVIAKLALCWLFLSPFPTLRRLSRGIVLELTIHLLLIGIYYFYCPPFTYGFSNFNVVGQ